jgi:hypothetical protein
MIKRKLPLLREFKLLLTYNYSFSHKKQSISIKSLIAPFRTPFWLEEKRWFVTCESIFQACTIRLYTTPCKANNGTRILPMCELMGSQSMLNMKPSKSLARRKHGTQSFGGMSQFCADIPADAPLHETMNLENLIRCEVSSIDYICRLTRRPIDEIVDGFVDEVCTKISLYSRNHVHLCSRRIHPW